MRIFFQAWFLLASVLLRGILELEKALQLSGDRLQLAHEANRMARGMARWCSYGVVGLLHGENLTMSFISAMYFARSLRSVCARSLGGGNIERDLRLQIHEMQQESGLITYACLNQHGVGKNGLSKPLFPSPWAYMANSVPQKIRLLHKMTGGSAGKQFL